MPLRYRSVAILMTVQNSNIERYSLDSIRTAFFVENRPSLNEIKMLYETTGSDESLWLVGYSMQLDRNEIVLKSWLENLSQKEKNLLGGYYFLLRGFVEYDNFEQFYRTASEIMSPDNCWLLFEGYFYYKEIDKKYALKKLLRCVELFPEYLVARIEMANFGLTFEERIIYWKGLNFEKNNCYYGLNFQANDLRNAGRFEESIEFYKRSLHVKPNVVAFYELSQVLYCDMSDFIYAERVLVEGLGHFSDESDLLMALGTLYFRNGEYQKAEGYLKKCFYDFADEQAAYLYVNILVNSNQYAIAKEVLNKLNESKAPNVDSMLWQTVIAYAEGNIERETHLIKKTLAEFTNPEFDWYKSELEKWGVFIK